jgi:dimeric dUTPase (all-alpha-NTP-PPase superfamily)
MNKRTEQNNIKVKYNAIMGVHRAMSINFSRFFLDFRCNQTEEEASIVADFSPILIQMTSLHRFHPPVSVSG